MVKQFFDVREERDGASDLLIEVGTGTNTFHERFPRKFFRKAFPRSFPGSKD
jgi:hypothetical protein